MVIPSRCARSARDRDDGDEARIEREDHGERHDQEDHRNEHPDLLASGRFQQLTLSKLTHIAGLSAQHGSSFIPLALDLRDGAAAAEKFRGAERACGGFDLVVNNAGYGVFGEFAATEFSVWQEQLEVMLVNTARLSHLALRGMRPPMPYLHHDALM